ncbi:MAG: regulatory protein GemA [Methylocystaceae bacterium]|nr:regulatory protein GemA [Methylocystaceae bacterium]
MAHTAAWHKANRAIRAACKERHIDEDQRKLIMEDVTGKTSSRDCTAQELESVLDSINGQTQQRHDFKPATKAYVRLIWALWNDLDSRGGVKFDDTRQGLVFFVNKFRSKDKQLADPRQLDWLTYKEATPIIEAIKNMIERLKKGKP